jgi:aminoglycoside phosphotransferase (APT) family kinase protein
MARRRLEANTEVQKAHEDELAIDAARVRQLVAVQFPAWAGLPVEPVRSSGTEHAIFRLGPDKAVRMPRFAWATAPVEKEHQWLPRLKLLPLRIPEALGMGEPGEGYPWRWAVHSWLPGQEAAGRIADFGEAADALGRFVAALQRIDTSGGPRSGPNNYNRGTPLADRDQRTREAIGRIDEFDQAELMAAWEEALDAPPWGGAPVWVHGDLHAHNLLVENGRVTGVIDFACLSVGDPAADLMVAWTLLPASARGIFRKHADVDDATWSRGRGTALAMAAQALPHYRRSNPVLAELSRRTLVEVLAERAASHH